MFYALEWVQVGVLKNWTVATRTWSLMWAQGPFLDTRKNKRE